MKTLKNKIGRWLAKDEVVRYKDTIRKQENALKQLRTAWEEDLREELASKQTKIEDDSQLNILPSIMEQALAESLKGDEFKGVMEKELNKFLKSLMSDSLNSYRNEPLKAFEAKYKEHVVGILSGMDLDKSLPSVQTLLENAFNNSIEQEANLYKAFNNLLGKNIHPKLVGIIKANDFAFQRVLKIEDLFNVYCEYAGNNVDTGDLEINTDDTPSYEDITCSYKVENYFGEDGDNSYHRYDQFSSRLKKLIFKTDGDENLTKTVVLHEHFKKENGFVISPLGEDMSPAISYLDDFDKFIRQARYHGISLYVGSNESDTDCYVEVSIEPEYTLS